MSQQLGNKASIALTHVTLADLARHEGNYALARNHYEESKAIRQELGDRREITKTTSLLGLLALEEGDYAGALLLLKEALLVFVELKDKGSINDVLWGIAWCAASEQMIERAARLWGAFMALSESSSYPPLPEDSEEKQIMDSARTQSDPNLWQKAWAEGRAMSMEQAIAYALEQNEQATLAAAQSTARPVEMPPTDKTISRSPKLAGNRQDDLTAREAEVLRLLATSLSDGQIADRLVLSKRTVQAHVRAIYSKLDVANRSAATRYAIEHRLP